MGQTRTLRGKQINCLSCKYNISNICTIFELLGKTNKPIPNNIMYRGCAYYLEEGVDAHPLLRDVIKMFKGKLIK